MMQATKSVGSTPYMPSGTVRSVIPVLVLREAERVATQLRSADNAGFRTGAFYFGLMFCFLRVSFLHEIVTALLGVNTYMLYLFGPPALLLMLMSGGIGRAFKHNQAIWWLLFLVWMAVSTPFSFWVADSLQWLLTYARTEFPVLLLTAGLITTWKELRLYMTVLAFAGFCNVVWGRLFGADYGSGRMGLEFGSMGNANDYAVHLLMVLPFILFLTTRGSKTNFLFRLAGVAAIGLGLYQVLQTGSRGSLVAIAAMTLIAVVYGTARSRAILLVSGPIGAMILLAVLPATVSQRLTSIFGDNSPVSEEAEMSKRKRLDLLKASIRITAANPVVGVGVNQFLNVNGTEIVGRGGYGAWQVSHNSYTQVSSEMGVPGFLFFVMGLGSSFMMLARTLRLVKPYPALDEIRHAAFCLMLSISGFCAGIFFLSLAYRFHLLLLAGLAISLYGAAMREIYALHERASRSESERLQSPPPFRLGFPGRVVSGQRA
jgi:O-antigen ligase